MFLCYQETAPGYISKLISARRALSPWLLNRLQLLLSSLHFTTACCPGPGFAEEELFFSWRSHAQSTAAVSVPPSSCPPRGPQLSGFPLGPMPSRLLLFLYRLARVHQEDRSYRFLPGSPIPSRPLLFLYRLARVHQEDRSSSLAGSRPLLMNVLTNALSVSSQHFDCHRHLPRNILVAQVTWLLRTCYPSEHPRMCYPSAHPRTC